ncbi:hypothetical protein ACFYYH_14860 [Streptomyces sp. NPDC002018]|uniref:hypothetical protein n=1 Tax=Streptomyces sp. NPDC002018 TaxID=3364629 RepID=UPI0036820F7E
MKLSAEAGVVLARAASEGHFKVLLEWERQPGGRGRDTELADGAAVRAEDLGAPDTDAQDTGPPDITAAGTGGRDGGL